ncbi:hypothetical protein BH09ACT1_BH09ACT1_06690 [soil metagenome]
MNYSTSAKALTSMMLAGAVLIGMAVVAPPANAYVLKPAEGGSHYLGFATDPLNLDACYSNLTDDHWVGIITAALNSWNTATPYVHFRSLRKIADADVATSKAIEPNPTPGCDVTLFESTQWDSNGNGIIEKIVDASGAVVIDEGNILAEGTAVKDGIVSSRFTRTGLVAINAKTKSMAKMDEASINGHIGTIVHELGHVLGLQHSNVTASIMVPTHQIDFWVPQPDDIAGIASIYARIPAPQTSAVRRPKSDASVIELAAYPAIRKPDLPSPVNGPDPVDLRQTANYIWLTGAKPKAGSVLAAVKADRQAVWDDIACRITRFRGIQQLGGQTFLPGAYDASKLFTDSAITLSGDADSVFIFRSDSTLTFGKNAEIIFTGGASAKNLFWQAGSTANIAAGAQFDGTLLADSTISLGAGAVVNGRLFSMSGAVDRGARATVHLPR